MSDEDIRAYPLSWPIGRPRAKYREAAPFHAKATETRTYPNGVKYQVSRKRVRSISEAVRYVAEELRRFEAVGVVISTNVKPTLSGMPSRETPKGDDPGVAVYFRLSGQPHAMSCDKWNRVADNLAALAKHIEAIRGQLRWGCADVAQVFAGFRALPAVGAPKPWWTILGFREPPDAVEVLERKRDELARLHHPDRGGNPNQMAEINAAYDQGKQVLERRAP